MQKCFVRKNEINAFVMISSLLSVQLLVGPSRTIKSSLLYQKAKVFIRDFIQDFVHMCHQKCKKGHTNVKYGG